MCPPTTIKCTYLLSTFENTKNKEKSLGMAHFKQLKFLD